MNGHTICIGTLNAGFIAYTSKVSRLDSCATWMGEDKYGHLRLLIWGFGGIFHANYGANEGANKITNNFLKSAIKIENWGLDTK